MTAEVSLNDNYYLTNNNFKRSSMKKNFLSIVSMFVLFFICSASGSAQVKNSIHQYLRDDQTGEWLIGLFENYAVYDCKKWEYTDVKGNSCKLRCGNDLLEVKRKKGTVTINGKKHVCSEVTSQFMPDYPLKDETPFEERLNEKEDTATLIVQNRSGKAGSKCNAYLDGILNGRMSYDMLSDSTGSFQLRVPLVCMQDLGLIIDDAKGIKKGWMDVFLQPGDTIFLYVDDIENRIYAMGANARLTNETFAYAPSYLDFEKKNRDDYSVKALKEEGESLMARYQQQMDSTLAGHPFLSARWKAYHHEFAFLDFIFELMQKEYRAPEADMIKYAVPFIEASGALNPMVPAGIYESRQSDIFRDYTTFLNKISPKMKNKTMYDTMVMAVNEELINLTDNEMKDLLTIREISHQVLNAKSDKEEESLVVGHEKELERVLAIFNRNLPTMQQRFQQVDVDVMFGIYDSIKVTPLIRELLKTRWAYDELQKSSKALYPYAMQRLRKEVKSPYLRNMIERENQKYIDYANHKNELKKVTLDETPLKNLTDGKDIFEKIISPYRGKFVYVDVWGTWCSPCREQMEHVPALKEMLKDKDVVYLYLCNKSSDEAWKNLIVKYHLNTENSIHYNLPFEQEAAVERYLEVNGFPTYRLVNKQGNLVPSKMPPPSAAAEIKSQIEKNE
jgi:thiol-disulfide isomerase/thioredoxin